MTVSEKKDTHSHPMQAQVYFFSDRKYWKGLDKEALREECPGFQGKTNIKFQNC